MEDTIMMSMDEFKELILAKIRIEAFADFVGKSGYSISREDCSRFLGFPLSDKEDQHDSVS